MLQGKKILGSLLTVQQMKKVKGGDGGNRKYVCVLCGPMDVYCASVPSSAQCEVYDYNAEFNTPGWMGCKNGSGEGYDVLDHPCP